MAAEEPRGLLMRPDDTVLTALTRIPAGVRVRWYRGDTLHETTALQIIPFGHKMACDDIPLGHPIVKYGEPIGLATADIKAGEHVHSHNVESQRGRGDLDQSQEQSKVGGSANV